jgi:hypothetical protein
MQSGPEEAGSEIDITVSSARCSRSSSISSSSSEGDMSREYEFVERITHRDYLRKSDSNQVLPRNQQSKLTPQDSAAVVAPAASSSTTDLSGMLWDSKYDVALDTVLAEPSALVNFRTPAADATSTQAEAAATSSCNTLTFDISNTEPVQGSATNTPVPQTSNNTGNISSRSSSCSSISDNIVIVGADEAVAAEFCAVDPSDLARYPDSDPSDPLLPGLSPDVPQDIVFLGGEVPVTRERNMAFSGHDNGMTMDCDVSPDVFTKTDAVSRAQGVMGAAYGSNLTEHVDGYAEYKPNSAHGKETPSAGEILDELLAGDSPLKESVDQGSVDAKMWKEAMEWADQRVDDVDDMSDNGVPEAVRRSANNLTCSDYRPGHSPEPSVTLAKWDSSHELDDIVERSDDDEAPIADVGLGSPAPLNERDENQEGGRGKQTPGRLASITVSAIFNISNWDRRISDIVYWRNPAWSAGILTGILLVLTCLACFPLLVLLASASLLFIICAVCYRVYRHVQWTLFGRPCEDSNPFQSWLDSTEISEEIMQEMVEVMVHCASDIMNQLRRLYFVQDITKSFMFGTFLWAVTHIGCWFSGITLAFIAVIAVFTIPKFCKTYKQPISKFGKSVGGVVKLGALGQINWLKQKMINLKQKMQ